MIAALFALLLQLIAHAAAGPAPVSPLHGSTVPPAPAIVAPAPAPGVSPSRGGDSASILPGVSGSQPGPAEETVPSCPAGSLWDPTIPTCVAQQLPGETIGRQYDPTD